MITSLPIIENFSFENFHLRIFHLKSIILKTLLLSKQMNLVLIVKNLFFLKKNIYIYIIKMVRGKSRVSRRNKVSRKLKKQRTNRVSKREMDKLKKRRNKTQKRINRSRRSKTSKRNRDKLKRSNRRVRKSAVFLKGQSGESHEG